jgi:DNA-binding MarR family transcriptional regulator
LIRREADAADSRATRVHITDAGRAHFETLWPRMAEAQERMFRGIPAEERRAFVGTLQKMLTNIRKHEI